MSSNSTVAAAEGLTVFELAKEIVKGQKVLVGTHLKYNSVVLIDENGTKLSLSRDNEGKIGFDPVGYSGDYNTWKKYKVWFGPNVETIVRALRSLLAEAFSICRRDDVKSSSYVEPKNMFWQNTEFMRRLAALSRMRFDHWNLVEIHPRLPDKLCLKVQDVDLLIELAKGKVTMTVSTSTPRKLLSIIC